MEKLHFYCQNLCVSPEFSIEEWNNAFKYCEDAGIDGVERDKILSPSKFPCESQCFACMAIVGERRNKTKSLPTAQLEADNQQNEKV